MRPTESSGEHGGIKATETAIKFAIQSSPNREDRGAAFITQDEEDKKTVSGWLKKSTPMALPFRSGWLAPASSSSCGACLIGGGAVGNQLAKGTVVGRRKCLKMTR